MFTPLFWFFAALTLIFGIAVVVNRNPVASALSLVISFMGLAALFIGLDAFLIGVLQVLVYAGAIMVLFLFIIMLLDLRAEKRRKFNLLGVAGGGLVALGFASQLVFTLANYPAGKEKFPPLHAVQSAVADAKTEGHEVAGQTPAATTRNLANRPQPSGSADQTDDVRQIGWEIFTNYNLPLQVVGVLLLVATVGVVVLSKRELH